MSKAARTPGRQPRAASLDGAPRLRTLLLLVIGVLIAHGLLLRTAPAQFGPPIDPAKRRAPVFVTRSIALPVAMPGVAAPVAEPARKPAPKPPPQAPKKPVLERKMPVVEQPPPLNAIESVAFLDAEPAPPDMPPASDAAVDSAPAEAEAPNPAPTQMPIPTPAPAASDVAKGVPPAAPPGSRQTVVTAISLPPSARLNYKVTGGAKGLNYQARSELVWQNLGDNYETSLTVSALFIGSRSMASKGQIVSEGLAPGRFADKYKNEVAAHFEPDKGQVSFSANTPSVPWVKGMQDRVSVFFQLAGMLAGKPEGFPVGSTIAMVTVGPRDADGWTFVVESAESLTLPFGELNTLKLSRQPRKEFDQKVEIWYAPSLGYLPVRSKITQANGDFVDQQLNTIAKPSP